MLKSLSLFIENHSGNRTLRFVVGIGLLIAAYAEVAFLDFGNITTGFSDFLYSTPTPTLYFSNPDNLFFDDLMICVSLLVLMIEIAYAILFIFDAVGIAVINIRRILQKKAVIALSFLVMLLAVSWQITTIYFPELRLQQMSGSTYECATNEQCGFNKHCHANISAVGGPVRIDGSKCVENGTQDPPMFTCLSDTTNIDTPYGSVRVTDIHQGDIVWSVDKFGNKILARVLVTHRTRVPDAHNVVDLKLKDGHEVKLSPGHPMGDGRIAGELRSGDKIDGTTVVSAVLMTYGKPYTYDILPSGDTGEYWADGVLLGSTLKR